MFHSLSVILVILKQPQLNFDFDLLMMTVKRHIKPNYTKETIKLKHTWNFFDSFKVLCHKIILREKPA